MALLGEPGGKPCTFYQVSAKNPVVSRDPFEVYSLITWIALITVISSSLICAGHLNQDATTAISKKLKDEGSNRTDSKSCLQFTCFLWGDVLCSKAKFLSDPSKEEQNEPGMWPDMFGTALKASHRHCAQGRSNAACLQHSRRKSKQKQWPLSSALTDIPFKHSMYVLFTMLCSILEYWISNQTPTFMKLATLLLPCLRKTINQCSFLDKEWEAQRMLEYWLCICRSVAIFQIIFNHHPELYAWTETAEWTQNPTPKAKPSLLDCI